MKSAVAVQSEAVVLGRSRLADYLELTKPRIAVMVLVTVAVGYCLAAGSATELMHLVHAVIGTGLVAAGASVLNQVLERQTDALMHRTENRPLPAGRLQPLEVLFYGTALGAGGLAYLALLVQQPWCVAVAALTFASYVGIYTPLKRRTTLNTLVGAVPGALPPLIGWTATGQPLTVMAGILFLVLFLWQVPHFLAIAWNYRADYGRAGLRMLPVLDETGRVTGRQMVVYCCCLVSVSLLPVTLGLAGVVYLAGVGMAGAGFLYTTLRFCADATNGNARLVLRFSLLYLPAVLLLLLLSSLF
jgi:protoheme IX farnesyltransferase